MATAVQTEPRVTQSPQGEQRVLLPGIGWEGYETLLAMVGEGHVRLTCNGEDVELMSPLENHEEFATLIGQVIETVCEELNLPCRALRTTTWRKKAQRGGLEADECFYLANVPAVRGLRKNFDLNVVPPPDLAVEIEISRSALDRMGIYARLGIPEVWRFDGESMTIQTLRDDGAYETVAASLGLPAVTPDEVVRWVRTAETLDDHTAWRRRLREWVRAEVLPRRQV